MKVNHKHILAKHKELIVPFEVISLLKEKEKNSVADNHLEQSQNTKTKSMEE